MINVATVCESSVPLSIILRQRGIISVCSKKLITFVSSILTNAPITPSDVSRKYSKGLPLLTVFRNGYKKSGICAFKNSCLVSLCEATLYSRASTLQALFDVLASRFGGDK